MDSQLKTFFIRTYGCQMNELESEVMAGQLLKRGLSRALDEETADLVIFNTCSVRDLAERKVMGKLGLMGRGGKKNILIGVSGCMAAIKKERLLQKFPHLDFVLGTNHLADLNAVIDEALEKKRVCRTGPHCEREPNYLIAERDHSVKANVAIARGCDKFCTYCIVPYARGRESSRSPESIIEECRHLAHQGYQEITLLGQNVNSYGKDHPEWSCLFHDLLYRIDAISGLKRIRFMTSHPVDMTVELMEALRDLPSLCEFVHFPMQAGSNRVLQKMHRLYTREEYFDKVAQLRSYVPHVSLGTDIIVGFPTETDAEFEETCDAMEKIRFSVAFLFAYSPRRGTPSSRWKDDVPTTVKEARLQRLIQLQDRIGDEERRQMIGKTVEVLVERFNRGGEQLKGRTRCWKKVIFEGTKDLIGTLQKVQIHDANHQTLLGIRNHSNC